MRPVVAQEFHGLDAPSAPEPEGELLTQGRPVAETHHEPFVREQRKVGRNEPCPCGSGKKYKHCHGKAG